MQAIQQFVAQMTANVEKVIVGKRDIIEISSSVLCLLCSRYLLYF